MPRQRRPGQYQSWGPKLLQLQNLGGCFVVFFLGGQNRNFGKDRGLKLQLSLKIMFFFIMINQNILWKFPTSNKFQVYSTFKKIKVYMKTHFHWEVKHIQCGSGCLCYSLFTSITINKLQPRSTPCVFL